jgi:hypothetical protein
MEEVASLADRVDNLRAASFLPLPPAMHMEQLRGGLREIRNELRAIVRRETGDDPWDGQPDFPEEQS